MTDNNSNDEKDVKSKVDEVASDPEAQLDKEMETLLDEYAKNAEFVENNLIVIQKTHGKVDDMPNVYHQKFLKPLYGQSKFKHQWAFASLIKGIIVQNKLFFSFSKASMIEMVKNDPDNLNKGKSFDMKPFCALLAENGIMQLWDAVVSAKSEEQKVAGYVVVHPVLRKMLKVDKKLAYKQYKELKKLADNPTIEWVTDDLIFDSCGELRVLGEDYRLLVEERRTKGSEQTVKGADKGATIKDESVANVVSISTNTLKDKLSDFLNDERIGLMKGWYTEGNRNFQLLYNAFTQYMGNEFIDSLQINHQLTHDEFKQSLDEVLKDKALNGFFGMAVGKALEQYASECDQFAA